MRKIFLLFVLFCSCSGTTSELSNPEIDSAVPFLSDFPQSVSNKSLRLFFELPAGLEYCDTEEFDSSESKIVDPGFTPKGSHLDIRCGDFFLQAVTPDFSPYEGMWPRSSFPSPEVLVADSFEGNYEYYTYGVSNSNSGIFVMDTYWGGDPGDTYWVSTYIPLPSDSIYKTARIGLRLDDLPSYLDENYQTEVDEYLSSLTSKTASSTLLKKLQDFEAILDSVKDLDDYKILP